MLENDLIRRVFKSGMRRATYPSKWVEKQLVEINRRDKRLQELRTIEAAFGPVGKRTIRRATEYSQDVFGTSRHWQELAGYAAIAGEFREGWIPEHYFLPVVLPKISGPYPNLARLKTLTRRLLSTNYLPDIGYFCNGNFLSTDMEILSEDAVRKHLFSRYNYVVFKTDSTWRGQGVSVMDQKTFNPAKIRSIGNGAFQRFVDQHEMLAQLSPGGVATIRIITILEQSGEISVRAAFLRAARAGETHVMADTAVRCPIDRDSGQLSEFGYAPDWKPRASTPGSDTLFLGTSISEFDRILETCKKLHAEFPLVPNIGWDVTVERDGRISVLEWGVGHGICFPEPMQGPCFADLGWERLWRDQENA